MNLTELSLAELRELQNQIPAELKRREKEEKANLLKEMASLAASRGFDLNDLLGSEQQVKKAKTPVAVKYRHPDNIELTWTGRGRTPKWIQAYLAEGGLLTDLH